MLVTRYLSSLFDASAERFERAGRVRTPTGEPKRGGNARTRKLRYEQILAEVGDPNKAVEILERIINGNDLTDVAYLARGALCARSVCRIEIRSDDNRVLGYGTGFLVAPGVMMTNNHVINDVTLTRCSRVNFDFERAVDGSDKKQVNFAMVDEPETISVPDLDFAIVRLAPTDVTGLTPVASYRWLKLSSTPGKTLENEYLTIIQHAAAQPKQVCVRENRLLRYFDHMLWYETDTLGGSSGSPVFNQSWQVVALHHSGVPERDGRGRYKLNDGSWWDPERHPPVDEGRIRYKANEGIRISSILRRLRDEFAERALAQAVLSADVPTGVEANFGIARHGFSMDSSSGDGRRLRIVVPVEITMGIVGDGLAADGIATARAQLRPVAKAADESKSEYGLYPMGKETLKIERDYSKRNGFDPKFLAPSVPDLLVPLPIPRPGLAATFTIEGKKTSVLKYWNYSVMLHASRKLALFSAGHVDFSQIKPQVGDANWIVDTRAKKEQTGAEFYKKQKEFEAMDRTSNPFDQGHLHMQAHATWGPEPKTANMFGADTFHYSNCAPQYYQYNQGTPDKRVPGDKGGRLWRGLEDFITSKVANEQNKRCIIITGPIFDAPDSPIIDGRPHVNLKGKRAADSTFGGLKIPKMFFKVVCVVRSGKLAASAFVISQEDYIAKIKRLQPGTPESSTTGLTEAQATLYRVTIPDLEKFTGLDFGLGSRAIPWFESLRGQFAEIVQWEDLL